MKFKFASEADLCAEWIKTVEASNSRTAKKWLILPETGGFDILAVRHDGMQVGLEAKLSFNLKVLEQALSGTGSWSKVGPDYRGIILPYNATKNAHTICDTIGLGMIRVYPPKDKAYYYSEAHGLPDEDFMNSGWWNWFPQARIELPEYLPKDVRAGVKSPSPLSHWKIQAIKLCLILQKRNVTRKDIKTLGMSPQRWCDRYAGFLDPVGDGTWKWSDRIPDFKAQHPTTWAEIEADYPKWIKQHEADMARKGW